jgi:hypothetical protein
MDERQYTAPLCFLYVESSEENVVYGSLRLFKFQWTDYLQAIVVLLKKMLS